MIFFSRYRQQSAAMILNRLQQNFTWKFDSIIARASFLIWNELNFSSSLPPSHLSNGWNTSSSHSGNSNDQIPCSNPLPNRSPPNRLSVARPPANLLEESFQRSQPLNSISNRMKIYYFPFLAFHIQSIWLMHFQGLRQTPRADIKR